MKTLEEIKQEYPLHWHIWQNNVDELKELLKNEKASNGVRSLKQTDLWAQVLEYLEQKQVANKTNNANYIDGILESHKKTFHPEKKPPFISFECVVKVN